MAAIPFRKMHGLGNDFVVIDRRGGDAPLDAGLVRRLADRHRGVGFDQLVLIEPATGADAALRFFNPDGGEAGACGNGTRCAARLLLDESGRGELRLRTSGGMLRAWREPDGRITVAMPVPKLRWQDIPLATACDTAAVPLDHPGLPRPVAVSMGNPHLVFIVPDLAAIDVAAMGAALTRHPLLPEGGNIGFLQQQAAGRLRLRVFERGAGLTLACGSGACAALVAAVRRGLVTGGAMVEVDGGLLDLAWDGEGPVLMTGPAALSFSGTLADELAHG